MTGFDLFFYMIPHHLDFYTLGSGLMLNGYKDALQGGEKTTISLLETGELG